MIDNYLKDFMSYDKRKKLYSACALVSLLFSTFSGALVANEAVQGTLATYPLVASVLSGLGAVVLMLARANATPDEPAV